MYAATFNLLGNGINVGSIFGDVDRGVDGRDGAYASDCWCVMRDVTRANYACACCHIEVCRRQHYRQGAASVAASVASAAAAVAASSAASTGALTAAAMRMLHTTDA